MANLFEVLSKGGLLERAGLNRKGGLIDLAKCSTMYTVRILLLAPPSFKTKVTLGDRAFKVAAPKLWNSLPNHRHAISDLYSFKRHLKTYF